MSDSFLCGAVGVVDVEDGASFVAICACAVAIVALSMSTRSSKAARPHTGSVAEQVERCKNREVVTAQQLKDGFRGIGRMVVTPVHVSIKKEIVKFGPPRTTFRAPDAKKLKYVVLLDGGDPW